MAENASHSASGQTAWKTIGSVKSRMPRRMQSDRMQVWTGQNGLRFEPYQSATETDKRIVDCEAGTTFDTPNATNLSRGLIRGYAASALLSHQVM